MPRFGTEKPPEKAEKVEKKEKKESRKRKSEASSKVVTLEVHADATAETDPMLLASFPQGGVVIEGLELNYVKASGWKFELRGETEELEISGSNANSAAASAALRAKGKEHPNMDTSQWAVGVYEPGAETMSLHAVAHVFPLRSTVKGYAPAAASSSDATSAKERRALLFEDFGASKKKRALAANAANQVSAEQAVGAQELTSWMGQAPADDDDDDVPDATDAALAEARKHLLPPFNLKTSDRAKCFDVRGVVGECERGSLRRQLAGLKTSGGAAWAEAQAAGEKWPQLALAACQSSDPEVAVDGLVLKHLVALYLKPHKGFKQAGLKEEAKAMGVPMDVLTALLDKFAAKQEDERGAAWRMTKSLMDKLALHLLVVALKLANFKVSTAKLSADLQMPPAAIANLLRQVGCKVSTDKVNGGHIALLEAPLVFPGRRRKRG